MNKSPLTLSLRWHLALAFVLTFAVASPFQSMAWVHAYKLNSNGHEGMAMYFTFIGLAAYFVALLILLPQRRNASSIAVVRALGRFPFLARYFLAFGAEVALFWLGILCEKVIV